MEYVIKIHDENNITIYRYRINRLDELNVMYQRNDFSSTHLILFLLNHNTLLKTSHTCNT